MKIGENGNCELPILASDPVAIPIEPVHIATNDADRAIDVSRAVAVTRRAVNVVCDWYARRVFVIWIAFLRNGLASNHKHDQSQKPPTDFFH